MDVTTLQKIANMLLTGTDMVATLSPSKRIADNVTLLLVQTRFDCVSRLELDFPLKITKQEYEKLINNVITDLISEFSLENMQTSPTIH